MKQTFIWFKGSISQPKRISSNSGDQCTGLTLPSAIARAMSLCAQPMGALRVFRKPRLGTRRSREGNGMNLLATRQYTRLRRTCTCTHIHVHIFYTYPHALRVGMNWPHPLSFSLSFCYYLHWPGNGSSSVCLHRTPFRAPTPFTILFCCVFFEAWTPTPRTLRRNARRC